MLLRNMKPQILPMEQTPWIVLVKVSGSWQPAKMIHSTRSAARRYSREFNSQTRIVRPIITLAKE
jgi:hypothetical protein